LDNPSSHRKGAKKCPESYGPLCQRSLIPVKAGTSDILVEGRLRSHYLIMATMGRVKHVWHEFARESRPFEGGLEGKSEAAQGPGSGPAGGEAGRKRERELER